MIDIMNLIQTYGADPSRVVKCQHVDDDQITTSRSYFVRGWAAEKAQFDDCVQVFGDGDLFVICSECKRNLPGAIAKDQALHAARQQAEVELEAEKTEAIADGKTHFCEACSEFFVADELVTILECGNDGTRFAPEITGTRRCETCGKFAAKTDDLGCPNCGEEVQELN